MCVRALSPTTLHFPSLPLITCPLVSRPQADGAGLPPSPEGQRPVVSEQGGHVGAGGTCFGEELEEGMCQIQEVCVVAGNSVLEPSPDSSRCKQPWVQALPAGTWAVPCCDITGGTSVHP